MIRAYPWLLGLGAMSFATPSWSDDEGYDGASCTTSAECGELHCIEGACRDPSTLGKQGGTSPPDVALGHRLWFGNGAGYGTLIAVVDALTTAVEPLIAFASMSQVSPNAELGTMLGVVAFALPALPSSTTHFAHGRVVPGIISFFAWPSLAGTTFIIGGLFGLAFERGFEFNQGAAWAGGLIFGAAGAVGLTFLDITMARTVSAPKPSPDAPHFGASIVPTRGGAMTTFGGWW